MNRPTTRTALVTAAVAGGTGVLLLATPVFANGPAWGAGNGTRTTATSTSTCPMLDDDADGTVPGRGPRGGAMRGGMMGGRTDGRWDGTAGGMMRGGMMGDPAANLPASGTLTDAQRTKLAAMAEEEKLAHDVYVALAAKYPATVQFARIANAEATHLASIQTLLARYGIDDPTTGMAAGEFRTAAFQSLYDDLVARATTTANALAVGVTIEKLDIADLTSAMSGLTAPDVLQVYTNLRNGSERHLAAFGG